MSAVLYRTLCEKDAVGRAENEKIPENEECPEPCGIRAIMKKLSVFPLVMLSGTVFLNDEFSIPIKCEQTMNFMLICS